MYVSAGGPYHNSFHPFFTAGYEERMQIRSTSNRVCWTALAGVVLMGFVLPAIGLLYLKSIGFPISGKASFDGMSPVMYYLLVGVDYVVGMALPAFLYFSAERMPLSQGIPFRKISVEEIVLYVAFGSMICILANYPANLVSKIQEFFGFSGSLPEMQLNNDPRVLVLYGFSVVIIPPLVEEVMFRGVILQSLRRYGDGFAVLVSAILFGLYHGNFIQMVFAFLSGLALGYAVIRTGSLLPSILIHFINNAVSFAVEIVSRFYGQSMANYVDNIAALTLIVLGVGATCVLAVRHKLFSGKRSGSVLPFSARMGAAFGNAGAICFLLYAIVSSVSTLRHG